MEKQPPQRRWIGRGLVGVPLAMPLQHVFLKVGRRVGEQHESGGAGVDGQPTGDLGDVERRPVGRQALDVEHVFAVENALGGVFLHDRLHVFHEWQGDLAQIGGAPAAGGQLPEANAESNFAAVGTFKQALLDQLSNEAVRGRQGNFDATGEGRNCHRGAGGVKGAENAHESRQH